MLAIGEVDGVEVVIGPIGDLARLAAIDPDLVEVERLLVVRLEAEQHLPGIPGEVGPPEAPVERLLRHELPQVTLGPESLQDHQPSPRDGHIPQAVARLMGPLGALGIRHIHEQHGVEIHDGVGKGDAPLHLPDAEVEVRARLLEAIHGSRKLSELGALIGEVDIPVRGLDARRQLRSPADLLPNPLRRGVAIGLMEPVALEGLPRLRRRQIARLRRRGLHIGCDGLGHHGPEIDGGATLQDQGEPAGVRRVRSRHQIVQAVPELQRTAPLLRLRRRRVGPLALREWRVLQAQGDRALGILAEALRAYLQEVIDRGAAGGLPKEGDPLGEPLGEPSAHGPGDIGRQVVALFPQVAARAGDGLRQAGSLLVHALHPTQRLGGALRDRGRARLVGRPHLVGREGAGVEGEFIQAALEVLRCARGGAHEDRRVGVGRDGPRPFERRHFHAIQVHAHRCAIEGPRAMVPLAIQHPSRIDGPIALHVAVDVQAQGQDRAVMLEREQDAAAALLAEDLPVDAEIGGEHPCREGDAPLQTGEATLRGPQGMGALQPQRRAVHPREGRRLAIHDQVEAGYTTAIGRDGAGFEAPVGDRVWRALTGYEEDDQQNGYCGAQDRSVGVHPGALLHRSAIGRATRRC